MNWWIEPQEALSDSFDETIEEDVSTPLRGAYRLLIDCYRQFGLGGDMMRFVRDGEIDADAIAAVRA